jgi:hypothetical protein
VEGTEVVLFPKIPVNGPFTPFDQILDFIPDQGAKGIHHFGFAEAAMMA